jgi:hypothetical protein
VDAENDGQDQPAEPIGRARGAARPSERRAAPKGASVPSGGKTAAPRHGSQDQQVSKDEALFTVSAAWRGITGLLAPEYQIDDREPRIRAQADAYKAMCGRWPKARVLATAVAPITFAGNAFNLGYEVWQSNPNGPIQRFVRRRFSRQAAGWEPTVVPGYEQTS